MDRMKNRRNLSGCRIVYPVGASDTSLMLLSGDAFVSSCMTSYTTYNIELRGGMFTCGTRPGQARHRRAASARDGEKQEALTARRRRSTPDTVAQEH